MPLNSSQKIKNILIFWFKNVDIRFKNSENCKGHEKIETGENKFIVLFQVHNILELSYYNS